MPAATGRTRPGTDGPPATGVQARITDAAFDLFADQGYEATTVEAITQRAGVARRTFFRYFRSKDDVIFPDHRGLLEQAAARLEVSTAPTPLQAVCDAVRLVFDSYVCSPDRSLARYQLTRSVPELREREITSVQPYQRLFTHYLARRTDDPLTAEISAAAVVAAHNHVLRGWLRAGGRQPDHALDAALGLVLDTFEGRRPGQAGSGGPSWSAVVAVIQTTLPADSVADRLRGLL